MMEAMMFGIIVPEHGPKVGGADDARGLDVLLLLGGEHDAARNALNAW